MDLKALGKTTDYKYDEPDIAILEKIPNPFSEQTNKNSVVGTIHIEAPEFTSICPVTGQPDFGTIVRGGEWTATHHEARGRILRFGYPASRCCAPCDHGLALR